MTIQSEVDRLINREATCDCGRKVDLDVIDSDPYRVIRRCHGCRKTSICYPFDQEDGLDTLRLWTESHDDTTAKSHS